MQIDDPIEVERLCGRLFLVTDRDDANKPAKRDRREKLAAKLGDRYYLLGCREVENLLSVAVLEAVVRSYEGTKAQFNSVTYDDYKDEPLGDFIEQRLLTTKQRSGSYATESGTVTDKLTFCERAINALTDFKELTDEAQKLTGRSTNLSNTRTDAKT